MEKKKVLIVDDSLVARLMIREIISSQWDDWEILEAEDAFKALEVCKNHEPSLFFIDVNMPGMNGVQLAKKLREQFEKEPILLLTANIQDSIKSKAEKIKVSYMNKPIVDEKIVEYLERVAFVS